MFWKEVHHILMEKVVFAVICGPVAFQLLVYVSQYYINTHR